MFYVAIMSCGLLLGGIVFGMGYFLGCKYASRRFRRDLDSMNKMYHSYIWNVVNASSTTSAGTEK